MKENIEFNFYEIYNTETKTYEPLTPEQMDWLLYQDWIQNHPELNKEQYEI